MWGVFNMIIDKVNWPEDVKKLTIKEKEGLAEELREKTISAVSKTGGHLASNLGVVELTIALHSCFNMPEDKIVWDVGHQTYIHKMLTGRKDKFDTLRQMDGIAGFPRTSESEYDSFDTGHSSTSISVALGMARARDVLGKKHKVVAVIGDGAMTGGMALEALNDAGISKTNLIVILNDNEMSISKNTGGLSMFLAKLRKQLVIPKMYFENIGFRYLGPINGHSIQDLEEIFNISKELDGPVLIHVLTKKGKGYKFAEENPNKYHSTSAFNIETGEKKSSSGKDYSKVMGDKLTELARNDDKIVAVTAAMEDGTGLHNFAEEFPNRFFDVEIAEQHALGMVAGMAKEGLKPVIPIYSSFLQRGYDQLIHDIAMQELPVVVCVDRAGIVGNDGETHQGILDLSFLNTVPKMNVIAPKNFEELEKMIEFAVNFDKPIAIRYPRGGEGKYQFSKCDEIVLGKAEMLREGSDVTIVAIGKMVSYAMEVADELQKKGIEAEVINARFVKPIDNETITGSLGKTKRLVTIEDNVINCGLASSVKSVLEEAEEIRVLNVGYPDEFVKHGTVLDIEKKYGMDVQSIVKRVCEFLK